MAKNGFKIIDAEMHIMEPVDLWDNYIHPTYKDKAPRRLGEREWDVRTIIDGEILTTMKNSNDAPGSTKIEEETMANRYRESINRNFDPLSQKIAMDTEGLDLAVLYPTAGLCLTAKNGMDPKLVAASCSAYNSWLYDYIQASDPDIMFGAAVISPFDMNLALQEVKRCTIELGFKAIMLRPNIHNSTPWHDPYYDPLWGLAQELNIAIGFHEAVGSRLPTAGADRFDHHGIVHISSHPLEQMLAMMDVIMGAVLERFPKLRFAFLEGNCGWLPFWLNRMDEHYEWRNPYGEMDHLNAMPSEYFIRQGFCAVECDEVFVSHVVDAIGDDHLVTTSDYPHGDAKYPHSMDTFMQLPLADIAKKKILWDNTIRLYDL
jgi:predicted TIM-barrel fold metal-dependent hydrolase